MKRKTTLSTKEFATKDLNNTNKKCKQIYVPNIQTKIHLNWIQNKVRPCWLIEKNNIEDITNFLKDSQSQSQSQSQFDKVRIFKGVARKIKFIDKNKNVKIMDHICNFAYHIDNEEEFCKNFKLLNNPKTYFHTMGSMLGFLKPWVKGHQIKNMGAKIFHWSIDNKILFAEGFSLENVDIDKNCQEENKKLQQLLYDKYIYLYNTLIFDHPINFKLEIYLYDENIKKIVKLIDFNFGNIGKIYNQNIYPTSYHHNIVSIVNSYNLN